MHRFVAIFIAIALVVVLIPYSPAIAGAETVYTFTGGGKSHGVGMSMAGVSKLAKAGRDYPTILKYYYRGVTVGPKGGLPKIVRAAVYSTPNTLSFSANNHIRVFDTRGRYIKTVLKGEMLSIRHGNGRYRITVKRSGKTIFTKLHPFTLIVKHWKASLITLHNNNRRYEGDFYARSVGAAPIVAINVVPLENYLRGLGEEPETWPIKGLRTLAVAARTYAVEKILKRKRHFDINQTQQFYVGKRKAPRMAFAVNSTRGRIITYAGKPIIAAYSANNGGFEADFTTIWGGEGYPYLKARVDPWSNNTKDYRWGPIEFSRARLESILKKNGVNVGTLKDIQFSARGVDKRPKNVTIVGTSGSKKVLAYGQFSYWLGLKSSLIWLSKGSQGAVTSSVANVTSLRTPVIVVDPGHGGRQYGAIGPNRLAEKTVNLKVALRLKKYLTMAGAKVIMTRSTDKALSLAARVAIAKRARADRFVSVHHNSSTNRGVNGTETYIKRGANSLSVDMARKIHKSMLINLRLHNRGARRASFYVLRNNQIPAVLTESSFISNRRQASLLRLDSYVDKEAKAIFNGLKSHMRLKGADSPLAIQGSSAAAADIYFPHVTDTAGFWRSYVTVKNTSDAAKTVSLGFYNDSGGLVGASSVDLAANQSYGFYPKSVIGADFTGSIKAGTIDASLVGQVSQASKKDRALGNVQAIAPSTELHAAGLADNASWSSLVSILNTASQEAAAVAINYYDSNGALLKTDNVAVGPMAKYSFYPRQNLGADFSGSIEVTGTQPIAGYVGRTNPAKTRFALAPLMAKSANLYFAQAPDNYFWNSYLTVKNPSVVAQNVTITGYNSEGLTGQQVVNLQPKSQYQNRVAAITGSSFSGSVKVSGESEVVAYLAQTDKKAISMGVMEGQSAVQSVDFARVPDGNTWSSEVAINNIDPALTDVGTTLFNGSGTLLSSSATSVNGYGFYSFNPWEAAGQVFNGSVKASAPSIQLVGYFSQTR